MGGKVFDGNFVFIGLEGASADNGGGQKDCGSDKGHNPLTVNH
jgi:hypothetical protein